MNSPLVDDVVSSLAKDELLIQYPQGGKASYHRTHVCGYSSQKGESREASVRRGTGLARSHVWDPVPAPRVLDC